MDTTSLHDRFTSFRPGSGSPVEPGTARSGRRLLAVAGGVLLAAWLVSATTTYINPGFVGIEIDRLNGGVQTTALRPGIHLRNPLTTEIKEYPVYMQTMVLTKAEGEGSELNDEINVNSREGQPISLDVAMSFQLDPARVPRLYETFRSDIEAIQNVYLKQTIRQALQEVLGQEDVADVLGPKKAYVVGRTHALLTQRLATYGIEVRQFALNEIRAPGTVMEAISAKNVMQQQALTAQNELEKRRFQATGDSIQAMGRAKAILAEAEAQAKANDLLSRSVTTALVQYETAKRWDGKLPTVSGGAVPMIQLPK